MLLARSPAVRYTLFHHLLFTHCFVVLTSLWCCFQVKLFLWDMYELENHIIGSVEMLTRFYVHVMTHLHQHLLSLLTNKQRDGSLTAADKIQLEESQQYWNLAPEQRLTNAQTKVTETLNKLFDDTKKQTLELLMKEWTDLGIEPTHVRVAAIAVCCCCVCVLFCCCVPTQSYPLVVVQQETWADVLKLLTTSDLNLKLAHVKGKILLERLFVL